MKIQPLLVRQIICTLIILLLFITCSSPAQTASYANWTSYTGTSSGGTGAGALDGINFSYSNTATGGASNKAPAGPVTQLRSSDSFTMSSVVYPAPGNITGLGMMANLNNSPAALISHTITFDSPIKNVYFSFGGLDYTILRFTGSGSEALVAGGSELVFDSVARTLQDSAPATFNDKMRDGYGSVLLSGGAAISSITWQQIDNPNRGTEGSSPYNTDGMHFTLVKGIPEPSSILLVVVGLGATLLRRQAKHSVVGRTA